MESHERFTLFTPRFRDFDVQGVLNSSSYLELAVEARFEQMQRHYGISLDVYTKRNQSWLLAKAEIEYLKPIVFGKQFFIETKVISAEGSKAIAEFKFHSFDKEIIHASGIMVCHLFDLTTRKLVSIDDSERNIFLST